MEVTIAPCKRHEASAVVALPAAMAATGEFARLCPATAVMLVKRLDPRERNSVSSA